MTETIIAVIITSCCTLLGTILTVYATFRKTNVEYAKRDQAIEDRLRRVEEKLDIHNGYAEKLADIQTDIAVIKNDIVTLKNEK